MTDIDEPTLTIPEELLLLMLDNDSGSGSSDLALGGGILAELVLRRAVRIEHVGKKAIVEATATTLPGPGDALLAECLADIVESSKHRPAGHWVNKFSAKKQLRTRVAERLVAIGVLDEKKRKILFIEITRYPEANPVPEAELTERLRTALELDHTTPDVRTVALLSIADAASLLTNNLDKKMVRSRKDRLKELRESSDVGKAVKASIDAINAAVIVAVAAGAAASS